MDTDINQSLWYCSLIMNLYDVQIHLTLTCKDQRGFMESSHSFSDELFIYYFLKNMLSKWLTGKASHI